MHELAFAEQILKIVEHEARKNGARKVTRVKLIVGRMSGVDKGSLSFCLEAIAAASLMDGARIEVTEVEPELICADCGRFPIGDALTPVCPACGKEADLSTATDLYVEEIDLHEEDDQAGEED